MNQVLRLALTSMAMAKARQNLRSLISYAVAVAIAAAVASAGLGFLLSALWIYLAAMQSSFVASVVIGVMLLVMAAAIYMFAAMNRRRGRRPASALPPMPASGLSVSAPPPVDTAALLAVAGLSYVAGRLLVRR